MPMPMPMRYDDGDATPVRQQSHRKSHRNFLLHPPPARKLPALVSALLVYLFSPSRSLQQLFVLRLSRFLLFTCWRQSVQFDWDFESDSASEFVPFRSTATPLRRIQSTSYVYVHFSLLCSLWVGWVYLPGGRGETYSHLLLHFFCWPKSGQSRSKPNRTENLLGVLSFGWSRFCFCARRSSLSSFRWLILWHHHHHQHRHQPLLLLQFA